MSILISILSFVMALSPLSAGPINNPAPIAPPPASVDHRAYMHGVNLMQLGGKDIVLFSSNGYPPTLPTGEWKSKMSYSVIDKNNAAATFSPKILVSAPGAQEPASAAVNSVGD